MVDQARWGAFAGPSTSGRCRSTSLSITCRKWHEPIYSFLHVARGPGGGRPSEAGHVVTKRHEVSIHAMSAMPTRIVVRGLELSDLASIRLWPGDPLAGVAFPASLGSQSLALGGKQLSGPLPKSW